jgi:hypothetical protein
MRTETGLATGSNLSLFPRNRDFDLEAQKYSRKKIGGGVAVAVCLALTACTVGVFFTLACYFDPAGLEAFFEDLNRGNIKFFAMGAGFDCGPSGTAPCTGRNGKNN